MKTTEDALYLPDGSRISPDRLKDLEVVSSTSENDVKYPFEGHSGSTVRTAAGKRATVADVIRLLGAHYASRRKNKRGGFKNPELLKQMRDRRKGKKNPEDS